MRVAPYVKAPRILALCVLVACSCAGAAFAEARAGGAAFDEAYAAAARAGGSAPSPLALRLALRAGGPLWEALPAEEAARLAYRHACAAERALRFGAAAPQVGAMLAQRIRLEAKAGTPGAAAGRLESASRTRSRAALGLVARAGQGPTASRYDGSGGTHGKR
ncbi:MAG: hypothetical protein JNG85_11735 [Spirochaetaceae bacterium]|nr:hypothetical protein [Spirochaetaceae bacterium]